MDPEDLGIVVALSEGEAVALRCAVVAAHTEQNFVDWVVGDLRIGVGVQEPVCKKKEKNKKKKHTSTWRTSKIAQKLFNGKGFSSPSLVPDGAFRHARHRQCDIQGDLALPSEDAHHAQCLHLAARGVD